MLMAQAQSIRGNSVLRLRGQLTARTYLSIRDAVMKAALDRPAAVIVDVNALEVQDDYAWAVFTSARWHDQQYPQVVIALACGDPAVHERLERLSISPYVPVFTSVDAAAEAIRDGRCRYRRYARTHIDQHDSGVLIAESFVRHHLSQWSMESHVPRVLRVTTVLVENALHHAGGGCDVRLEGTEDDNDEDIFIAVSDPSTEPAIREPMAKLLPAGLDIVSAICRFWGSTATPTGKTVWARVALEDAIPRSLEVPNCRANAW
jgi:anti-anti-sigma regulatory factor